MLFVGYGQLSVFMNVKTIGVAILILLGVGTAFYALKDKQTEPTPFLSDLGSARLADGYLALILDRDDGWKPLDEVGLVKNHGVGHASSPCPDFFAPVVIMFPEGPNPPPSNLALNAPDLPWLSFPVQVGIPADGNPQLPGSVPPLPEGFFSDPFFVNFNCNIAGFDTQQLNGPLNITIYNQDNSQYRPTFQLPVNVDVFAQQDYPAEEIFTDGFEEIPATCANLGTPEEDCWNLIVFP